MRRYKKTLKDYGVALIGFILCLVLCFAINTFLRPALENISGLEDGTHISEYEVDDELPEYFNEPYIEINNNIPYIAEDATIEEFEEYSELDELGRCGTAYANISRYTLPTEDRGSIGSVKPSGWHSTKYDFISGKYLYNRCHLIGYQLAAENANNRNLITGTRYLNIDGMLPFENMVADYVKQTGNHVLYRVTPNFVGDELVCRGVFIEGYSVEDDGLGISFNVYCYNVEPGVIIDYQTGESYAVER